MVPNTVKVPFDTDRDVAVVTDDSVSARWTGRYVRRPNDRLRRARLRLVSPSGSGRPLSRQELAEAVNAYLFTATGRVVSLDGSYVGGLERGEYRWPGADYRRAFRAVLGAATDVDLGFFITRPMGVRPEPDGERDEPDPGCRFPDGRRWTGTEVLFDASAGWIAVRPGEIAVVVCGQGDPPRLAVVSGPARVRVEPAVAAAAVD